MTKRIVLCADDYGQAPSISQAILALIEQGRLSATSCLVNTAYWLSHAKLLSAYQQKIEIGLHLNLTEGKPLSKQYRKKYGDVFSPLSTLMGRVFLRSWDIQAFLAEGKAQIEHFANTMGFLPHYLDGHQHVHQFPGIRRVIVQLYQQYFPTRLAYVRLVNPSLRLSDLLCNMKKMVIIFSGTFFKQLLEYANIPHNPTFSGIYHFNNTKDYRESFLHFVQEVQEGGLIMCHPGISMAANDHDPIARARYAEYQYLSSALFLKDCVAQGIDIQPFNLPDTAQ